MNDFGAFKLCSMVLSITVLTSFACGFPPEASASDAFISGQVQVSDGSPAAAAKVILIQLPSDGSERTAKVGSPLKIIELAHTISGASGEFSFGPEVERLARVSTGGANSLNFQIVTISGDEMGSYFFSVEPGATLTGRVAVASNISTPAQNMQLRTLKGPGDSSRASSATAGDNHAIPMDNPTTCSSRVLNKYNPRWSTVGATWSKTGSVDSTFVYSRGSNSSLGVGVSAVGSSGSFSASGTNSVTTTDATTFPIQSANSKTWMRSEFLTGRYVTSCTQQLPYKTWNTYYSRHTLGRVGHRQWPLHTYPHHDTVHTINNERSLRRIKLGPRRPRPGCPSRISLEST